MDLVILVAYYYAVISVSSRDCISEHRVPTFTSGKMLRFLARLTSYQTGAFPHRLSSISASHPSLYRPTTLRAMASLTAERYLADRAPPICRVEVAKSFSQLTSVSIFYPRPCSYRIIGKKRSFMRTISARHHGLGLALFKGSGRHKRPAYTTS